MDSVADGGVIIINKGGRRPSVASDIVVLIFGMSPVNKLARGVEGRVKEIYTIRDARESGRTGNTISGVYVTAYEI